jgi:hypothetical protein
METVAYLQLAQSYESEPMELHLESAEKMKRFAKAAGVAGVTGAALAGSLLASDPASACGYGGCGSVSYYPSSCYSSCQRPVYYRPTCYSSCYQRPYYSQSYYPDHYYSSSHSSDNSYRGCGCGSSGGDYHSVSYLPEESNLLTIGSRGQLVVLLQQALSNAGFDPGGIDGVFGHQTANAVAQYQAANGLSVDGVAGGQTLDSLGLAGAGA